MMDLHHHLNFEEQCRIIRDTRVVHTYRNTIRHRSRRGRYVSAQCLVNFYEGYSIKYEA